MQLFISQNGKLVTNCVTVKCLPCCVYLQLAAVVWFLTCVGAVFNGITILILGKPVFMNK